MYYDGPGGLLAGVSTAHIFAVSNPARVRPKTSQATGIPRTEVGPKGGTPLMESDEIFMTMLYSFVAITVALAAIVGAWSMTKEALRKADPSSGG